MSTPIKRVLEQCADLDAECDQWHEVVAAKNERIAELEAFKAEALVRIDRLSMALTRIECECSGEYAAQIAKNALYPSQA